MERVSAMLADDDFIAELAQGTTNDQEAEGDDANSADDYKFERDDDQEEDNNDISAEYGSEQGEKPKKNQKK